MRVLCEREGGERDESAGGGECKVIRKVRECGKIVWRKECGRKG